MSTLSCSFPRVFASFRCQRSLVCCRAPFRVWIEPKEISGITSTLSDAGAPKKVLSEFAAAVETLGPGRHLMAQSDCCNMLETNPPACLLQKHGGPQALPTDCQCFPRSPVGTPVGPEAAFFLDCPTVASMVATNPQPFEWLTVPPEEWPYPCLWSVPEQLMLTETESVSFASFQDLRSRWWENLDPNSWSTRDAWQLLERLALMDQAPADPSAGLSKDLPALELYLNGNNAPVTQSLLERLPQRGKLYRQKRDLLANKLEAGMTFDSLVAAGDGVLDAYACAASVLLQVAGVHDRQPITTGIRRGAKQVMIAFELHHVLSGIEGLTTEEMVADALYTAAHLVRFEHFGVGVFVD